jgi:hypothetical protein
MESWGWSFVDRTRIMNLPEPHLRELEPTERWLRQIDGLRRVA